MKMSLKQLTARLKANKYLLTIALPKIMPIHFLNWNQDRERLEPLMDADAAVDIIIPKVKKGKFHLYMWTGEFIEMDIPEFGLDYETLIRTIEGMFKKLEVYEAAVKSLILLNKTTGVIIYDT